MFTCAGAVAVCEPSDALNFEVARYDELQQMINSVRMLGSTSTTSTTSTATPAGKLASSGGSGESVTWHLRLVGAQCVQVQQSRCCFHALQSIFVVSGLHTPHSTST